MTTFARVILRCAIATLSAGLLGLAPRWRPAETYSIDPVHSSAIFRIKHLNTSYFYGRFDDVRGTISFDEASPTSSSVEVQIKADSVDTHDGKRDSHLKSPDFFNAAKYPTLSFKSKSFAKSGDNAFDVSGDLTVHGETKPVTVKFEKTGAAKTQVGERIGFETTFTIKRSEYGIAFMPDGLGEDVRIIISLEGVKK